jgi:hypothetical protein
MQCAGSLRSMNWLYRRSWAETPLLHDETKLAPSRAVNSTDDFIECPTCYDTFPKADLLKNRCFKAGEKRALSKLMPVIKSVDCTPQDGYGAFSLCSHVAEPDEEPSYVDGPMPLDYDACEVNAAAMLDLALSDSECTEIACIDACEIERVHTERLNICACKRTPRTFICPFIQLTLG